MRHAITWLNDNLVHWRIYEARGLNELICCQIVIYWLLNKSNRELLGIYKNSCLAPVTSFAAGMSWWRHQMETFSALLALCAGNSPVTGEFPSQRPVMRSFDVFFDLRLNRPLSKQSWSWWFETPSSSLWRHRNGDNTSEHCHSLQECWCPTPAVAVVVILFTTEYKQWRTDYMSTIITIKKP